MAELLRMDAFLHTGEHLEGFALITAKLHNVHIGKDDKPITIADLLPNLYDKHEDKKQTVSDMRRLLMSCGKPKKKPSLSP